MSGSKRPASVRSQLQACSYPSLHSILKRSLDRADHTRAGTGKSGPRHENVRGADYYDPPTNVAAVTHRRGNPNVESTYD